jgi:CRP/FNR family transcriptional regulator, cyclic AMP receptor protein
MAGRSRTELEAALRSTPLFSGLSKRQLGSVAKLCFERTYAEGDVLVRQADTGQLMAALVAGRARVERDGKRLGTVSAGDVVGEMSLIDGLPCSASVVAETSVEAIVLHRTAFRKLLQEAPSLTAQLLVAQTARVRELDRRVAAI